MQQICRQARATNTEKTTVVEPETKKRKRELEQKIITQLKDKDARDAVAKTSRRCPQKDGYSSYSCFSYLNSVPFGLTPDFAGGQA